MWQLLLFTVCALLAGVGAYHGLEYFRDRFDITPVDSLDVESLLRQRGMWDAFISHQIRCVVCGEIVTFGTLGSIAEDETSHEIDIVCRNPDCLGAYVRRLEADMWDTVGRAS